MNIVFTSDLSGLGGGEVSLLYIMEELISQGNQVSLICRYDGELVKRAQELGVNVHVCNFKRRFLKLIKLLNTINKESNIDIVHSNELTTSILFGVFSFMFSYKNVTTCHGQWYKLSILKKKLINKYISHIYCVSNAVKLNLEKQSIKNISVSYLGVPTQKFLSNNNDKTNLKTELGLKDEIVILTIARYQKIKGQLKGVEAIQKLINSGLNIRYLLIGDNVFNNPEDEKYKQEVLNYIDKNKLGEHINILGERRDIPDLLSIADIVLITSDNESFGVVAIESLASDRVVLSTPCDGVKEILCEDENMISKENTSDSLSLLIKNYIINEELQKNVKVKMKEYFKRFDVKTVVEHYMKFYE